MLRPALPPATSAAGPLHGPTLLSEPVDHRVAVIALEFDDPVLRRPAGPAGGLELLAECGLGGRFQRKPLDHGHTFTSPALGFA